MADRLFHLTELDYIRRPSVIRLNHHLAENSDADLIHLENPGFPEPNAYVPGCDTLRTFLGQQDTKFAPTYHTFGTVPQPTNFYPIQITHANPGYFLSPGYSDYSLANGEGANENSGQSNGSVNPLGTREGRSVFVDSTLSKNADSSQLEVEDGTGGPRPEVPQSVIKRVGTAGKVHATDPPPKKKKKTDILDPVVDAKGALRCHLHERVQNCPSLAIASQCNVCGNCSFSSTENQVKNFMRRHIYSHCKHPAFHCALCDYKSNFSYNVSAHVVKQHNVTEKLCKDFVVDKSDSPELDEIVLEMAKKCFPC